MSFAGHVFDMIKRNEANRALLRARRDRQAHDRRRFGNTEHHPALHPAAAPELVEAEIRRIREAALREKSRQRRRGLLLAAGAAAALALLLHICLTL